MTLVRAATAMLLLLLRWALLLRRPRAWEARESVLSSDGEAVEFDRACGAE